MLSSSAVIAPILILKRRHEHSGHFGDSTDPLELFRPSSHNVLKPGQKGEDLLLLSLYKHKYFPNYLRVVIVAETFCEGVMVYFQLSDLCREQEEGSERM